MTREQKIQALIDSEWWPMMETIRHDVNSPIARGKSSKEEWQKYEDEKMKEMKDEYRKKLEGYTDAELHSF
jgi:hypothetical protein